MLTRNSEIMVPHASHTAAPDHVLNEYTTTLWRWRWLILSLAAACAATALGWSYLQTPIYQAKATIVIEQEGPGILERDRYHPMDVSPEYFQTHFELMKSYEVLQRTARRLHLADRPDYQSSPAFGETTFSNLLPDVAKTWWKQRSGAEVTSKDANEELLLEKFSRQVDIMPVRGARLAHMMVSSVDPKFAAEAANTLASVYIERTQELTTLSKEKSARWFTEHLNELRKKVESSHQALYLFRSQHGLLDGQHRQSVAVQKVTELNSELVKAEVKKAEAETRYEQIKRALRGQTSNGAINWSNLGSSTEVLSSPLIQSLRTQEIKASNQVAELSEKYGELHPKLAHAKSELQGLRGKLQEEVQKIYDSMKHEYDVAVARESAIREAVARNKKEKIRLEQYEIEQGILEREAESSQHLYDMFLKVSKEADVSSAMRVSNVYLADPAVPSIFPVKPKKKLNAMLGCLVGLMTGVGVALFLESRDRSLKNPDDIERYLPRISLLGVVPLLGKDDMSSEPVHRWGPSPNLAAESFRTIRTGLLLSAPSELPSILLVTSPRENDGKTTLAVNLSTAMAQLEDSRVVLINADLRTPNQHAIFQIEDTSQGDKGLVHFLLGDAEIEDIVHETAISGLSVIPRGNCPSNPSELLFSKHLTRLLEWCRKRRYHVIIDAPPVLPVTDPVVLAPQVDGILLVVSAGETTREECRLAVQRLTIAGGKFHGLVLQKVQKADCPYYSMAYSKNGSRFQKLNDWMRGVGASRA